MIQDVFLLLGGNLGNRSALLQQAREGILDQMGEIQAHSSLYETAAWGVENQPAFLNQVVKMSTDQTPFELLKSIHELEAYLGRQRHERWHARTIDIDILYFADQQVDSQRLTLPHPQLHNRRFTLVPLVEIAPHFVHPKLKQSNLQLLENCQDILPVQLFT